MFSSDPQTIRASKGPAAPQVYLQKDVYRRLMMRNRPKNNDFDRQFKKVNLSKLAAANSTSKKQRKYFSMINEFQTSLQKSAFEMGFFKAAQETGCSPQQAAWLLRKYASESQVSKHLHRIHDRSKEKEEEKGNSSAIGRYFSMKGQQGNVRAEEPWKSIAGAGAGALVPYGGLAGTPEMAQMRALGGTSKLPQKYEDAENAVQDRSYGGNMAHAAKQWVGPMATLGGLAGAGFGALNGFPSEPGAGGLRYPSIDEGWNTVAGLHGMAAGAGIGTGAGALYGGLAGAGDGAMRKYISNNTSAETKERAREMKSKHPYSTSLPFGDVFGANLG